MTIMTDVVQLPKQDTTYSPNPVRLLLQNHRSRRRNKNSIQAGTVFDKSQHKLMNLLTDLEYLKQLEECYQANDQAQILTILPFNNQCEIHLPTYK